MTRTKEMFMEMQEENVEAQLYKEMQEDLSQLRYMIPPIDIGSLQPSIATSEQIANGIISAVVEGRISPIELAVKRKCIADALDLALKNEEVKKMIIEEVEKFGKEGASCMGAKITVTSKGTYKYEADPKWKALNDSIADTLLAMKEQEEKIKCAVKNNASLIDSDTGEMIASIVPAPATDSVVVSFKAKK